jgi:hypothetical protein
MILLPPYRSIKSSKESQNHNSDEASRRESVCMCLNSFNSKRLWSYLTHSLSFKFCQPETDGLGDMSRSLSRIRSLVSEIEEIHRQGQQGGQANIRRAQVPPVELAPVMPPPKPVEPYSPEPSPVLEVEADPFEDLAKVVHLDERRDDSLEETPREGEAKVFMQLTGAVAVNVQIGETGEVVQLKQIGKLLEIRFTDGKAFHIPLKAMA